MRYHFIIIFLMFINTIFAQESKRNNTWVCGYSPTISIDFNTINSLVDTFNSIGLTFGSSAISDTNGKLSFFCNGYILTNSKNKRIEGWDSINCPLGLKLRTYYLGDGFFDQMSIILPKKKNSYYVFTTGMSDSAYDDWKITNTDFRFDVLSYSIVDMDANASDGKVLSKNNILLKDARLSHNRMTAVRHANGRDWWLVKPHQWRQKFYTYLVKEDTISGPYEQNVNFDMSGLVKFTGGMASGEGIWGIYGQSVFSPDGNWYASTENDYKGVFVYKFDRCSGGLTDYHYFAVPVDTCYPSVCDFASGISFSANNKFLYFNTLLNVWQIEISDTTTINSLYHISQIDTDYNYFPWYGNSYLAPNGKIYIGNMNGTQKGMSYIDNPNVKGIGCNYKPKGFRQQFTNLVFPPNMPNYGLGALIGSDCDTIKPPVIDTSTNIESVLVPNAFSPNEDGLNDTWHILNIPYLQQEGIVFQQVGVYNRWGNCAFKSNDINFAWRATGWASDSYYYYIRYKRKDGFVQVQKGSVELVR